MCVIDKNTCSNVLNCSACDFKNISYEDTLKIKKENFLKAFKKENIKLDFNNLEIVPSLKKFHYRTRCQIHIKNGIPGFYKRGTNEIVEIRYCPLLDNRINERLKFLNFPKNYNAKIEYYIKNNKLAERIVEKKYDNLFSQVNEDINTKLKEKVVSLMNLKKTDNVLELFCGSGNFTFEIAKTCSVLGIDIKVKKDQKNKNLEFIESSVLSSLKTLKDMSRLSTFNKLLLDPPRKGLKNKELDIIKNEKFEKIIYVSCSKNALIKNTLTLINSKYKLSKTILFDMFPFTKHIESINEFEIK
jgi:23S rRNA (uracil1939-C5)-methyltransferase